MKKYIFIASEDRNRTVTHFNIYMENLTMFLPFNYVSTLKNWQRSPCLLYETSARVDAALLPYKVMHSSHKAAMFCFRSWLPAFIHLEDKLYLLQITFLGFPSAQPWKKMHSDESEEERDCFPSNSMLPELQIQTLVEPKDCGNALNQRACSNS